VPIYLVHIDDGGPPSEPVTLEARDCLDARREATAFAGEMLRDRPDAFWTSQPWRITVTDEATGAQLFAITVEGRTAYRR